MALLTVENLVTRFHTREGVVRAVEDVSFSVEPGETLGIVGESGSGKSVTCYSLLGLVPSPPGRVENGTALLDGIDLLHCSPEELRSVRGKRISMIFQDPMTALNPYMRIGKQLAEPLRIHENATRDEAVPRAIDALKSVGLQDAERLLGEYPHQLSGGMRQRVMIAMAMITKPDLLIADEPTTALDVTVQAQVLDLMKQLQKEDGTAVILVTHDLGVIAKMCDRVLVMYAGRILESAETRELFYHPKHPYTTALMESMPSQHAKGETLRTIPGMPPDLTERIEGCPFAPRCSHVVEKCRQIDCHLSEVEREHESACVRVQDGEI